MCNLYSVTKGPAAIRDLFSVKHDRTGNLPLLPAVFPEANAVVPPIHPKAMPVILTSPTEVDRWLEADTSGALERTPINRYHIRRL